MLNYFNTEEFQLTLIVILYLTCIIQGVAIIFLARAIRKLLPRINANTQDILALNKAFNKLYSLFKGIENIEIPEPPWTSKDTPPQKN